VANESITRVTADASGYRSELDSARKSANAFMQTQDQAAQRVLVSQKAIAEATANGSKASASAINSFVSSLTRAADTAGKTRSELLELKAAQLGVSEAAADSIAKLRSFEQETGGAGEAVEGLGIKSVGARREIAVMIHEASQGNWKNLAGSVQVFGEKIDLMGKLMSPAGISLGLAAAAAVGFIYEVAKGAQSLDALGKSAQLTNGYLGLTTDQLQMMSMGIAGSGQSITDVQAAMTALVTSGQVAADQLSLATKVTAEFASDTGISAQQAAEAMIKFAQDPQKALEELQAQYHTFSAAQVDVIENYIKTGDSANAYKAILQGMDQAHQNFKASAAENLGFVQQLFAALKEDAQWELSQINQIGMAATSTEKLTAALKDQADAQRNLAQAKGMPFGNTSSAQAQLDAANAQVAAIQKVQAAQNAAATAQAKRAAGGDGELASQKYLSSADYATPLQQRNLAIQKENAAYTAAIKDVDRTSATFVSDEKRHADNLAEIDKQYASRNGSKSAASAAAAAAQNAINAQLTSLDAQQKAIEDSLKTSLDHIKSLQEQGLITQESELSQSHDLRAKALSDQLAIEQQEVEIATGKKQKSAMEKYAAEVKATQTQITANDQQYTDDAAKLAAKRVADLKVYTDALNQQLATQQSAADAQLAGVSLGGNDRADFNRQLAIRQDYDKKVADLAKQQTENKIGPDQYASELAATQDYYNKSVAIAQKSSDDIRAANADWTTGALRSIADYSDAANNVAASTASTFSDSFRGMEDAFATFATTGKLSFSSLATSVIADIARMEARAVISGLFNYAVGAVSGYFGSSGSATSTPADLISGYTGHATGGLITGPGTGTSDSILARLSNGEGVVTAAGMKRIGVPGLNAINGTGGGMARFATGGVVGPGAVASSTSGGSGATVALTVQTSDSAGGLTADDAKWLQGQLKNMVDARLASKMKGQGGYAWQMKYGSVG
jgi:lambda family phage tail tape measure protein